MDNEPPGWGHPWCHGDKAMDNAENCAVCPYSFSCKEARKETTVSEKLIDMLKNVGIWLKQT